jgi:hypothetical protein
MNWSNASSGRCQRLEGFAMNKKTDLQHGLISLVQKKTVDGRVEIMD